MTYQKLSSEKRIKCAEAGFDTTPQFLRKTIDDFDNSPCIPSLESIKEFIACEEEDRSYPSPLEQIIWRIEDLEARLAKLSEKHSGLFSFDRFSEEEIEYVSPQYFSNTRDIIKAIEIAKQKLSCMVAEYAIDIYGEFSETEIQEETGPCSQLKFTEIASAKAA